MAVKPIRVTVTGAAGNISYALLFRLASGHVLGTDQPIELNLLEIPQAMGNLEGVAMELTDCAFPLLQSINITDQTGNAFQDTSVAFLVGSRPRSAGMERKDLLEANAQIFRQQGRIINEHASRDVKVLVVGNPANTNALIACKNAPDLKATQFSAMTMLDHNRALAKLASHLSVPVHQLKHMIIWGNHSSTQYPDISHCQVGDEPALSKVSEQWLSERFMPVCQKRGAAVIQMRGASSAASAAHAALEHMRYWVCGTPEDDWVSMAVLSDGSYGIDGEVFYSFPVTCKNGEYSIVKNLSVNDFSRNYMDQTYKELMEEREAVKSLF